MSFATAGATSSVTAGIAAAKSAIKKVSKDALLKGAKRSFKYIKKEMKSLVTKAAKDIRKNGKDYFQEGLTTAAQIAQEKAIEDICNGVANQLVAKEPLDQIKDALAGYAVKAVDTLTSGSFTSCKKVAEDKTANNQIGCAKAIIDTIAAVDPTGILSIAGTFMQPQCAF